LLVEITNIFLQDFLLGKYLASPKNDSPRPFAVPQTVKSSSIKKARQENRSAGATQGSCATAHHERSKQSWASVEGQTQAVCSRNITGEEEKDETIDEILPNL
jgi:hypothetical protein